MITHDLFVLFQSDLVLAQFKPLRQRHLVRGPALPHRERAWRNRHKTHPDAVLGGCSGGANHTKPEALGSVVRSDFVPVRRPIGVNATAHTGTSVDPV